MTATIQAAPACPGWCNSICKENTTYEEYQLHAQQDTEIPATVDDEPTRLLLALARQDQADTAGQTQIAIALSTGFVAAGCSFDEEIRLSPQNARRFATELLAHADLVDRAPAGEVDVPATEVKVGDLFEVDGEWLYVYGVSVDEPSFKVQVFTTVDRGEWPELDGDEDPHMFELTEWVRVRRAGGAR